MSNLVKPWNDGGNLSVAYEGSGDGSAIFSSETNEGLDREMYVTFKGAGLEIERKVKQEGKREIFYALDGAFLDADGGTFNGLKSDYWFVDYLESDGTQVIDTQYLLKEDDVITLNYSNLQAVSGDSFMFGSKDESKSTTVGTWISVYGTGAKIYVRFGHSTSLASTIDLRNYNQVIVKKGSISTSDASQSMGFLRMPSWTFAVFGRKDGENKFSSLGAMFRLHSLTVIAGRDVKLDLRPVIRKSDNKAGLLDMRTNAFFVNINTGNDFVVGDIIG